MKQILLITALFLSAFLNAQNLNGSWMNKNNGLTELILIQDNYLTRTLFSATEFIESNGGTVRIQNGKIILSQEFNSKGEELKTLDLFFKLEGDFLYLNGKEFKATASNQSQLAGVWKISGRMQDGKQVEINHTGSRKTLKLLSGNYFQWFAIDPAENKFYETGGGTFSFDGGKYIENIEFFSKDNSRVGASLNFEDRIENEQWIHTGLSSKGEPIYEIWSKAL